MTERVYPLHIKFSDAPPIGTIIAIKGREFEVSDVREHTRRDGEPTNVISWLASCIDCGCDFQQTTGRSFTTFKRRCDPCRSEFMKERDKKNGPA